MSSPQDMKLLPASAGSSNPHVEESPDTPEQIEQSQPSPTPAIKANMVAQEVRLKVTGVHLGKGAAGRELFTEETSSVLVHENGGVILLSAAVTPGQLLFLANVESKREVVAQVKRKRAYRPTSCFVELEFAEPAPRFWGMEFSAASSLLPKDPRDSEAAALVTSAEASSDQPPELSSAPTGEQVQALKQEVQALTGQTTAVAVTPQPLPVDYKPVPIQLTPAEEAQLPKPSLDFTIPKTRGGFFRARGNFTPGFRGGVLRLAVLIAALILTAVGAAWYKNWIPWKVPAKKSSVSTPAIAGASPPGIRNVSKERSEFGNTKVAADAPVTSPGLPSQPTQPPAQRFASSDSTAPPSVTGTSSTNLSGKRTTARPTVRVASDPVVPATDSVMVPPKLIKSVRALSSLDALRDFETGNVVIDAIVGAAGEVHFLSVISGPPSLRPAAVEAVKQYQYEPATRNGQPVPARVRIEIRFRFES